MVQEAVGSSREANVAASRPPQDSLGQSSVSPRQRSNEETAPRTAAGNPPRASPMTHPDTLVGASEQYDSQAASQSRRRSVVSPASQARVRSESSGPSAAASGRASSPPQFASPDVVAKKSRSSKGKKEAAKIVPKPKPEVSPKTMRKTAANIKQEKTTPPSNKLLTNTMHTDQLKGMLMNMNTEMELPMSVPGAQVNNPKLGVI